MKKRFIGAVLVMAVWAAGAYALGRHHGATKGAMELPAVHVEWKKSAEEPKEAKAEVVDFIAISTAACSQEEQGQKK